MNQLLKRYIVKIPNDIEVFYCSKRQIVLISGPVGKKLLNLKVNIEIDQTQNVIKVLDSSKIKKSTKNLKGTVVALLKQSFLEVSTLICKKLNLNGVGFKAFPIELDNQNLIHLKLGYSHGIFFKVPESVAVRCHKADKLFVFGASYTEVSQIAAQIRSFRAPEPYKGKGISYSDEIISLKEGKKV